MLRLSVVIPALNEAPLVGRAVSSAWEAGADEVLVADGGSSDGTPRAAACSAQVIAAPRGRAAQQNAAARLASGDVLLFLHADNWLAPDAGRQIRAALAAGPATHGALWQRIEAAGWCYRWLERGNAARVRWCGVPYGDQAIFIRRAVFEAAGGWPEAPLLEDVILMRRLRRASWPLLLPGPVFVSPRRWQRHGVIRQTLRNWRLLAAFALGASPERLAAQYRRHDA
ncbi:MAG TPA: TIGR04283 family arsenosugar biosynthesis glycosyltransferase [Pirellulaceae bacterium]|nr:TIGR04283 family arsenosugar biosynthesis glycosyltransferase [Pirellulaceae bacterium]